MPHSEQKKVMPDIIRKNKMRQKWFDAKCNKAVVNVKQMAGEDYERAAEKEKA